jgi:hypothetical protein
VANTGLQLGSQRLQTFPASHNLEGFLGRSILCISIFDVCWGSHGTNRVSGEAFHRLVALGFLHRSKSEVFAHGIGAFQLFNPIL